MTNETKNADNAAAPWLTTVRLRIAELKSGNADEIKFATQFFETIGERLDKILANERIKNCVTIPNTSGTAPFAVFLNSKAIGTLNTKTNTPTQADINFALETGEPKPREKQTLVFVPTTQCPAWLVDDATNQTYHSISHAKQCLSNYGNHRAILNSHGVSAP